AVLPQVGGYLSNEIGRRFTVDTNERLFAAATGLPGLHPLENPRFLDRLRMAQDGMSMGGSTETAAYNAGGSVVTLVGFVGSLLVISPVMTGIVLAAAVPAMLAQLHLSHWRAGVLWQISPIERWRGFYVQLLSQVDAAKEIRLFGSGGF